MKRLHTQSQHFLRNPRFVSELIGHTTIKRSDTVFDIGAGSGVIASKLAGRCKEVIAIEIDKKTADILRKNMTDYPNVIVKEADFLKMLLPQHEYKIFANIPFHLSSPILRRITEASNPPTDAYIIVQKQFANKLLPDYNGFSSQLGMILGVRFAFKIRKHLKRTDFWPHPNVDTVLLEVKHRDESLIPEDRIKEYEKFIESHFTIPKLFSTLPLHLIQKESGVKPSSLTLHEWLTLFQSSH